MRTRVAAGIALLAAVLAGCGAARPASTSSPGDVGCGGWFMVSHDTLAAHVQLLGPVRTVAVNALLDDGTTRGLSSPVTVSSGSTRSTIHVRHVDGPVVSAVAQVVGDGPSLHATCDLSNPH